jgi:3-oxoacyl-[acyl-carrier protein] reductase
MATPSLHGKTVIVTGAARGLGQVLTLGLLRAGANVVAMYRATAADLMKSAPEAAGEGGGRFEAVRGSVTDQQDCERVVKTALDACGAVHVLVNNAGIGMHAVNPRFMSAPTPFWELDPEMWRLLLETNATGQFLMARAVTPHLVRQGWGRLINMSTSFTTMLRRGASPYGPPKAAVEASTAVWAKDLAGTGVTVNALLPGGATNSPAITDRAAYSSLLDPQIMVPPAVWLCSEASDGTTGRRFIAREWNSRGSDAASAALSSYPAAW